MPTNWGNRKSILFSCPISFDLSVNIWEETLNYGDDIFRTISKLCHSFWGYASFHLLWKPQYHHQHPGPMCPIWGLLSGWQGEDRVNFLLSFSLCIVSFCPTVCSTFWQSWKSWSDLLLMSCPCHPRTMLLS